MIRQIPNEALLRQHFRPRDLETIFRAFTCEWERLGDIAQRVGVPHGNRIIRDARRLRDGGRVESRFWIGNLQWRRAASAGEARSDATPQSGAAEGEHAVANGETPNNSGDQDND